MSTSTAERLYNELVWYPNDWIHKTIDELASLLDVTHQTILTAIQELEEQGLLEVQAREYDRRKNKYHILAPWQQHERDISKNPEREGRAQRPPFNTNSNTEKDKIDGSLTYDQRAQLKNQCLLIPSNKGICGKPTSDSTNPPDRRYISFQPIPILSRIYRWISFVTSVVFTTDESSTATPPTALGDSTAQSFVETPKPRPEETAIEQYLGIEVQRRPVPKRQSAERFNGLQIMEAYVNDIESDWSEWLMGEPKSETGIVPDTVSDDVDYDSVMEDWISNTEEEIYVDNQLVGKRQGCDWTFSMKEQYLDKQTIDKAMDKLSGSLSDQSESKIQAVRDEAYERQDLPLKYWVRRDLPGTEVDYDEPYGYYKLYCSIMKYARSTPNGYEGDRLPEFHELEGRIMGQFKNLANKTDVKGFVNAVEYAIKRWDELRFDGTLTLGLILSQYDKWKVRVAELENRGRTDDEVIDEDDGRIMESSGGDVECQDDDGDLSDMEEFL